MSAIYKREMRAYFTTFIGYAFIAAFLVLSGIIFAQTVLSSDGSTTIMDYYVNVISFLAIVIPILTMKLFTDEKRLKTEALLLSSPVSLFGVVMAKYLAALTMFAATFAVSCVNLIPAYAHGSQNTAVIITNIVSVLLVGGAFIAIGVFISSLTENQIVSAISTIAVIMLFNSIGDYSAKIKFAPLRIFLNFFSISNRYTMFTYGRIDWAAIVYYASLSFVFLFLTVRIYERRRWA